MMRPEALDRIIPGDPREAVRARYADLAASDRPGDPWAEPFEANEEPVRFLFWIAVGAAALVGLCLIASIS